MPDEPLDSLDDAALMAAVVGGSEDALERLYDRHVDAIFGLVMRLTDDRSIAEEVTQETFLTLWNRAELFDPAVGSLGVWLRTIARNRTFDRLRAAGRRPRLLSISAAATEDEPAATGATLDRLVAQGDLVGGSSPGPGPESAVEAGELRNAIRAALRTLPDAERVAIELAYRDELTQAEIAERLGWPLGTVKTRTRRALHRLREVLAPESGTAPGAQPVPLNRGNEGRMSDDDGPR